jgi:hypothetical protein
VALELNKLTGQVEAMGQAMARRQQEHADLVARARAALAAHAQVTDELRRKIAQAHQADTSWRGADPLGDRLDERYAPGVPPEPAILIAADGSQIYPDRHGIALYYLLNVGSIVLRQGSGQAPETVSRPALFFADADLYDEAGRLRTPEYVNRQRDRQEVSTLVELAEAERTALGGDLSRPLLTLSDGPLLPWTAQRGQEDELDREVAFLTGQLSRLRRARAVPLGYVDRPNSAYVLRTLELVNLALEEITREAVRRGPYRRLTDRLLFADLEPNQRTGLFASTSEVNDRYAAAGHRILFFYVNVASRSGPEHSIIARVELPEWAAADPVALDLAQQAVYADCRLTGFPYVLARSHELAVVGTAERADLEAMLGQAMLRNRLSPMASAKAGLKLLTGVRRRQSK